MATSFTSHALFPAARTPRPIAVSVPAALVVLTTSSPVYLPEEAPLLVIAPLSIVPAKVAFCEAFRVSVDDPPVCS